MDVSIYDADAGSFTFWHVLDAPAFHREVWDFKELSAIFYVLFGATFLPYLLIPMSLKRIRPTTVSMYDYVQPIVASFIAVMIGQDTLSWQKSCRLSWSSQVFIS